MRMVPEEGNDFEQGLRVRTIPDAVSAADSISDLDWHEFTMKHLAPAIGCIIAFIMFMSPLKAILQVRRQKHLGDFNPLPLVSIIANCCAWLVYGSITQDPYVILANEPGLMMGLYMTITAYGYADSKARDSMLRALLFFGGAISVCSISISLFIPDLPNREMAAGYQAVGVLLCYYAAPLSVLADVFRSHSSSSLYWPLAIMSCINGSLWVAYGLAKGDPFIWAPNAVGAFFGVLQLLLICIFPSKSVHGGTRRLSATGSEDEAVRAPLRPQSNGGDT